MKKLMVIMLMLMGVAFNVQATGLNFGDTTNNKGGDGGEGGNAHQAQQQAALAAAAAKAHAAAINKTNVDASNKLVNGNLNLVKTGDVKTGDIKGKQATDVETNVTVEGDEAEDLGDLDIPVSSANTSNLVTSNQDMCSGSTTAGIQLGVVGASAGSTHQDGNCIMIKNARELREAGHAKAATMRMCLVDGEVDESQALALMAENNFNCYAQVAKFRKVIADDAVKNEYIALNDKDDKDGYPEGW